ncbi:hypothetical protein R3P38DRAFT_2778350 [Favolaschia claudopus]|uniref:Secreted protein n=1 Tax=Favolaschia claudopus TaxID=2862362 RepID=A0AAW0BIN6_9AGAR
MVRDRGRFAAPVPSLASTITLHLALSAAFAATEGMLLVFTSLFAIESTAHRLVPLDQVYRQQSRTQKGRNRDCPTEDPFLILSLHFFEDPERPSAPRGNSLRRSFPTSLVARQPTVHEENKKIRKNQSGIRC